jgi:predicted transcriptional regulator
VKHDENISYEKLCDEAHGALRKSNYTQAEIADLFGVTRGAIAKAVTIPGPRFHKLQIRIISYLTDYKVEKREKTYFHVTQKNPNR